MKVRILTVLAIFVGVMLLVGQILVGTAVAAHSNAILGLDSQLVSQSLITRTITMTSTRPVSIVNRPSTPTAALKCVPEAPQITICPTLLPIIGKSPFQFLGGLMTLVADSGLRVKGLTTFVTNSVTINYASLQFSKNPESIKWEHLDSGQSGSVDFDNSNPILENIPVNAGMVGAQPIKIDFLRQDAEPISLVFTFFYIPNGDFSDPETNNNQWNLEANVNGAQVARPRIKNDLLQLFVSDSAAADPYKLICSPAKVGFALASIDLELPTEGEFYLRVQGTVFTQDQNPSNSSTFDAFEVVIDGNVADRVSNIDQPIRCDPVINRQVVVDSRIPLSGYAGNTTISLENHRRCADQYVTYTEIDMVWIDY